MKISYLSEFLVLADTQHFTAAADQLQVTQPSLSRHISALEEALGATLVNRSTHDVRLTPAGEAVVPYFKKIAEAYEEAEEAVRALDKSEEPPLHVGFDLSLLSEGFYQAIQVLGAHDSGLALDACFASALHLTHSLRSGQIDAALIPVDALSKGSALVTEHTAASPLEGRYQLCWIMRPDTSDGLKARLSAAQESINILLRRDS